MFKKIKLQSKKVVPIICKTDGLEYEEYRLYDECYETDFFAIRNIPFDQGVTSESIKLFEQVNHRFGQFIQAKVNDRDFKNPLVRDYNEKEDEDNNYLVLLDEYRNQLHLTGCTCGYSGTGPYGTLEVLNKAGFCVDRRFIFCAQAFDLPHPNINIDNEL
ncbi:hypothetical protein [Bacillus wiedmannii]|uniref:hypothetical protein n=1 Tax=Bacillus wiedmannii TaxID=1890302 RepID=UPI000BF38143|nr:hypothetical protein [Bacillus wiedmannii]MED2013683.1 hypothetical protein [Bacillus wiedmannii]PFY96980.1 hypothetical protein COL57_15910 [Bacillus wiedmannii]